MTAAEQRSDELDEKLGVYPVKEHMRLRWRNIILITWMVGATLLGGVGFYIVHSTQVSNARTLRIVEAATSPQAKADSDKVLATAISTIVDGVDCKTRASLRELVAASVRSGLLRSDDPAVLACQLIPPPDAFPTTTIRPK